MSVALVKEVFNHAPAELTPLERLVLLAIAEKAQDGDREDVEARVSYPSMEVLTHWTGKSPGAVRAALRRLEGRGYKVRVPCGTDHAGRPVYAYPGRATRYRVPRFPRRDLPGKGVTTVTPSESERRHEADAIGEEWGHPRDAIAGEWRHGDDAMASPGARDGVTGVTLNQKEPEGTTPLPPAPPSPPASAGSRDEGGGDDPRRPDVERAARSAAVEADLLDRVVDLALADAETHTPVGRMARDAGWRGRLVDQARAQVAAAERATATDAERGRLLDVLGAAGEHGARALADARYAMPTEDPHGLRVLRSARQDLVEAERTAAASA